MWCRCVLAQCPHLSEHLGQVEICDGPEESKEDLLNLLQDSVRERGELNLEEHIFRDS